YRYVISPTINSSYRNMFNDKLINYYFLKSLTDKACPILGYIDSNGKASTIDDSIRPALYVIKPKNGWGGKGIRVIENIDNLNQYKKYIICPFITANPYAHQIYPGSLNTVRILTYVF